MLTACGNARIKPMNQSDRRAYMDVLIVVSIVILASGAFATFPVAAFLPHSVLIRADKHGRLSGLGDEVAWGAKSSVAERHLEPARARHVSPV